VKINIYNWKYVHWKKFDNTNWVIRTLNLISFPQNNFQDIRLRIFQTESFSVWRRYVSVISRNRRISGNWFLSTHFLQLQNSYFWTVYVFDWFVLYDQTLFGKLIGDLIWFWLSGLGPLVFMLKCFKII
jgi:hypothetical protein